MTAVVDLAALPPTVVVPGIARWLGLPDNQHDEPEETYEDYLQRLSEAVS